MLGRRATVGRTAGNCDPAWKTDPLRRGSASKIRDETGWSFALKLTAAGLKAIAVDEGPQDAARTAVAEERPRQGDPILARALGLVHPLSRRRTDLSVERLANISDWPEAKIDSLRRVLGEDDVIVGNRQQLGFGSASHWRAAAP